MAREADQSQPVTGRTPWDALVEISNRFAPPILIVAVVAWALYEYRKSDRDYMANLEEARAQASEDYKNELNQLHDALIKTYQTMQSITDARIEKFGTMLDLGDQVVARTAELSKKEQDQQKRIDESERHLEATLVQLADRQAELERLETTLEENQKDLNACNVATIALSHDSLSAPTPMGATGALGSLSAKYDNGGRSPGTVSSGIGDAGGVSYGSYQMTSRPNGGTVARFVSDASFPWRDRFASLQPGSAEFSAEWRALASEAPEAFFQAQHDFVKRTHYDPLVRKIKAEDGIEIDRRSRTLRDAVWSTALQHGPNTPVVHRALAQLQTDGTLNPDDADFDERLIKAIYAERSRDSADGDLVYFARNSDAVQAGVRRRYEEELRNALEALRLEQKQPT